MHLVPSPMNLLEALGHFYPDSSQRTLRQWIKHGRIFVDEEVIQKASHLLSAGQKITLKQKDLKPSIQGVKILYQDRWLVAIDKPAGLLSVPIDDPDKASALDLLKHYFASSSIFPVHRIDRETSGVLLFARGTMAEGLLDTLFEAHAIEREYIAVVEGNLPQDEGTWRSYLLEKENYDVITTTPDKGKEAITHYRVYRRSKCFTFLRVHLETGRKHQIRVHCKEAGHPVVGDIRYGSFSDPIGRLCLHAHLLGFVHPFTQKKLRFTSPLPRAFSKIGA